MKNPIFILFSMIFCHIIDDYYLQRILASLKQKKYWEENAPQELYKNDYKMALFMHSFSWSFMIIIPILLVTNFNTDWTTIVLIVFNTGIHMYIDDLKANKLNINLIQDQTVHLFQIFVTWLFCFLRFLH